MPVKVGGGLLTAIVFVAYLTFWPRDWWPNSVWFPNDGGSDDD